MDKIEATKLYQEAVKKWGKPAQIQMVIEEASELITAVSKFIRSRYDENCITAIYEMANEHADVLVMLDQLKLIMGNEYICMVEGIKDEKLERLKERLNKPQKYRVVKLENEGNAPC